jgi:hypothetical protein
VPGAFDRLGAIVRLPQAAGGGLELIDRLSFDFRRPGHGDEFEFGGGQEPCLKFHRIIHWELVSRVAHSVG